MEATLFLILYYGLSISLLGLIAVIIKLEYKAQNIALLFWIVVLVVQIIPSFLDPFNRNAYINTLGPTMNLSNNPVLLRAQLFTFGFSAIYLFTRLFAYATEFKLVRHHSPVDFPGLLKQEQKIDFLLLILMVVAVIGFTSGVYAILSRQGWAGLVGATYTSYRLEANPYFKLLGFYLVLSISAGVFMAWYTKHRLAFVIILLSIASVFLLSRTRQLLLPMMIPFAFYFIYKYRTAFGRFKLLLAIVFGYGVLLLFQVMRYQGGLLASLEALGSASLYSDFIEIISRGGGEAALRFGYYFFIQEDLYYEGFMTGQTYQRLLLLPIPYQLSFGLKPRDFDEILYNIYYNFPEGHIFGTFHALMFGNAYANFGWLGTFLGGFWALAAHFINLFLNTRPIALRVLLLAPLGMGAVMIARGSIYNSVAIIFWTTLLGLTWYLLSRLRFKGYSLPFVKPVPPSQVTR